MEIDSDDKDKIDYDYNEKSNKTINNKDSESDDDGDYDEEINMMKDSNDEVKGSTKHNEVIQVEFLFSEIRESYFFDIKTYLLNLLDLEDYNISELADLIIAQRGEVGTVIKTELEEDTGNQNVDLYALLTLINLNSNPDSLALTQIKKFLLSRINEYMNTTSNHLQTRNGFIELINNPSSRIGLVINQRANNLPLQLVAPLLNLLVDDISDFKLDNPENDKFDLEYIIYFSK